MALVLAKEPFFNTWQHEKLFLKVCSSHTYLLLEHSQQIARYRHLHKVNSKYQTKIFAKFKLEYQHFSRIGQKCIRNQSRCNLNSKIEWKFVEQIFTKHAQGPRRTDISLICKHNLHFTFSFNFWLSAKPLYPSVTARGERWPKKAFGNKSIVLITTEHRLQTVM